jgi:hypothetical protein
MSLTNLQCLALGCNLVAYDTDDIQELMDWRFLR